MDLHKYKYIYYWIDLATRVKDCDLKNNNSIGTFSKYKMETLSRSDRTS